METSVNYSTVTAAAVDVRTTSRELTTKLGDLMAEVTRFTAGWEGEAKTAYAEIQTDVNTQMTEMNAKLGVIANLLDESVIGYQGTDKRNAARFHQ